MKWHLSIFGKVETKTQMYQNIITIIITIITIIIIIIYHYYYD